MLNIDKQGHEDKRHDHEAEYHDDCCTTEDVHEHDHHDDEGHDDCCSTDHEHNHHHHDHEGCACESGILEHIDEDEDEGREDFYKLISGAILFAIGFYIAHFTNITTIAGMPITSNYLSLIPFILVVIIAGKGVIIHGLKELSHGEIKIEFLMTVATVGAFMLGDFGEGAGLMLLYFFGEILEDYALDNSRKSIAQLVKLSPDTGVVKRDGKEIEMRVEDIKIGDIVVIRPGDKIPIDGIIVNGSTSVNQASITGESLAVNKTIGDEVYSSTINEEGYIEIEVNKESKDTIFAKIVDLIKESEEKKAKINLIIDEFAKYYTPLVIALALIVAIIPTVVFGQELNTWVYRALVLLVTSCPCALVISIPVSVVSAVTAGTNNGMIIKGGEYIEELANIKAISFDKTGTLTEGKLEIDQIIPADGDFIEVACSIECDSKHPIAEAFKEYAIKNNITTKKVDNFKSIAGKGLIGEIDGVFYKIGKKDFFDENLIDEANENIGKTRVYVGTEDEILGFISLSDKIRDESVSTINSLNNKGIRTVMLTGDNNETAETVASKIGLSEYYSNLLPEDKVNKVQELVENYQDVAMVGDGVNDTPSLARANVGIAMGMQGADVAVETADIILMRDDISKIDYLIELAYKTMRIIKENITVTLSVKAIITVLAIIGMINLWGAIIAGDVGLMLVVVANALRISRG